MRQVFCITAYKEFDYLEYLVSNICKDGGIVFVHIDKKSSNYDLLKRLNDMENVFAISKYEIPWGGVQHIYAILELMNLAILKIEDNFYLHIITGQDFICKSIEQFNIFFCESNNSNYMSLSKDPSNEFRYRKFYRNDIINYKSNFGNYLTKILYIFQKILLINRRPFQDYTMYKGLVYVSITKEFCVYVTTFLKSDEGILYIKYIKWCFIPEEFFFQTLAMNSIFKDSVVNDNKRYILWEQKHGVQPGVLDEYDYASIVESDCFFARKFSLNYSSKLIDILNERRDCY